MKLLDFFKSINQPSTMKLKKSTETKTQKVQFEAKFIAQDLTLDTVFIQLIVDKMVKENPLKNFYTGKIDSDFGPLSKRVYKYDAVITVNVNLLVDSRDQYFAYIEGINLGKIPLSISKEFSKYYETYLLTACAYATGGYYKEYSTKEDKVIEAFNPYGLELHVQFS